MKGSVNYIAFENRLIMDPSMLARLRPRRRKRKKERRHQPQGHVFTCFVKKFEWRIAHSECRPLVEEEGKKGGKKRKEKKKGK